MSTTRRLPRVRVSDETHRVTTFELFFDLVFVFAYTQITAFMVYAHDSIGVLQGLTILGLLWWSWVSYSWLGNQTHVDEGVMRIGMSLVMVAIFFVALSIPEAYDDLPGGLSGPLVVALGYFAVRLIHLVLYVIAADDDAALRRQVLRTSIAMFSGTAVIVAGAIIGGPAQTWMWLGGLVLDGILTYALSKGGDWRVQSPTHWAERHGLVIILALGESIVAIGVGASQLPVSVPLLAAAGLGIVLAVGLWWLYFDVIQRAAEHILARTRGQVARAALATDGYTYLHVALVAGIVLSALGIEDAIANLDAAETGYFGTWGLFGGAALYLAGHAAFWRRVGGHWKRWRLAGATVLLAAIPIGALLPPLGTLAVAVAVVFGVVVVESVRNAEVRAAVREGREHHERHDG